MGLLRTRAQPVPERDYEAFRFALIEDGAPESRAAFGAIALADMTARFARAAKRRPVPRGTTRAQLEKIASLNAALSDALSGLSDDGWAHIHLLMPESDFFSLFEVEPMLPAPRRATSRDVHELAWETTRTRDALRCAAASFKVKNGRNVDDQSTDLFRRAAIVWRRCTPNWPPKSRDSASKRERANQATGTINSPLLDVIRKVAATHNAGLYSRLGDGHYKNGVTQAQDAFPNLEPGELLTPDQDASLRDAASPTWWVESGSVDLLVNADSRAVRAVDKRKGAGAKKKAAPRPTPPRRKTAKTAKSK